MGVMNIGVRALIANQNALSTIGHNIANVNTAGYSRQSVILSDVPGQFSGSGYYGSGVQVETVVSTYNEFLTRQASLTKSQATFDSTRYDRLSQLENVFQGGPDGLGASISNMFNAYTDVVSAPNDLTARTVVLTRADEMTSRLSAANDYLDQLGAGVKENLKNNVDSINSLAKQIANLNDQIALTTGTDHAPNDLIDQRNQLINDLNRFVQTRVVPADDGTLGVFIGNGQALVLGKTASVSVLAPDVYGTRGNLQLAVKDPSGTETLLPDEQVGGEMGGLLRFLNKDLTDARNYLGRMTLAIGTKVNEQQTLGLNLSGDAGTNLFNLPSNLTVLSSKNNSKDPGDPTKFAASLSLTLQTSPQSAPQDFKASDYELAFTSATTGRVTRLSDGNVTTFDFGVTPPPLQIDGLEVTLTGTPATGDKFLLKPFADVANNIQLAFRAPQDLALASPLSAAANVANSGTLTIDRLNVTAVPAPPATAMPQVDITFSYNTGTGVFEYTYTDPITSAVTTGTYTSGSPIAMDIGDWSYELILKGVPSRNQPPLTQDTFSVQPNTHYTLTSDNARAMLDLRDFALFDGGPLTDGYASLMAHIGVKVQSAKSASQISANIATNTERDRASIAGVNLDEEAAKMLQYQQAYQAAGKMLQMAQAIFDTVLQALGR